MPEPIQAKCTGCGRNFAFDPDHVRELCQICGSPVRLPDDYVAPVPAEAPETILASCPICGRPKEHEASFAGNPAPCWFCGASLLIPGQAGPAELTIPRDPLTPPDAKTLPESADTSVMGRMIHELMGKMNRKGTLPAWAAKRLPSLLRDLVAWTERETVEYSPFGMPLTGEILRAAILQADGADIIEEPDHQTIRIDMSKVKQSTSSKLTSPTVINTLGFLTLAGAGTGYFIIGGSEPEVDETVHVRVLLVHLRRSHDGTRIEFQLEDNGKLRTGEKAVGRKFIRAFPSVFEQGARALLFFKLVFGGAADPRLMNYLTSDTLSARMARLTGDEAFAEAASRSYFSVRESPQRPT